MFCWKPQLEGNKVHPSGVTNVHHHTTYIAFLSLVKVIRWDMPSEMGAYAWRPQLSVRILVPGLLAKENLQQKYTYDIDTPKKCFA